MGEYINKYANSAAIQSAVDGGELIKPYVALDESTGLIDWNNKSKTDYSKMPLTFEITNDGDIYWKANNTESKTIQYKLNGGEWTSITSTSSGSLIEVVTGDVLQFRGDNQSYGDNGLNPNFYNGFNSSTTQFKVKGNIMSLIDSTNFSTLTTLSSNYTFCHLFNFCRGLTDASKLLLPATTLANNCYTGMFAGCTSLTTAPELPATTLVANCYSDMFYGCTSLTTAPELPATTLARFCYMNMFRNCTSLNYIKCLATKISGISVTGCTSSWVDGVASTGTFVTPSSTNWSTGTNGIPNGWTRVDA